MPKRCPISHNWYSPLGDNSFAPIELVHSQSGTIFMVSGPSRLSKRFFAKRHQELTQKFPQLSSIVNLNSDQTAELQELHLYYRGLKMRSTTYRDVKRALMDTFRESGLGTWIRAPIHVDLFPINS